jgi:hypothetical protein
MELSARTLLDIRYFWLVVLQPQAQPQVPENDNVGSEVENSWGFCVCIYKYAQAKVTIFQGNQHRRARLSRLNGVDREEVLDIDLHFHLPRYYRILDICPYHNQQTLDSPLPFS